MFVMADHDRDSHFPVQGISQQLPLTTVCESSGSYPGPELSMNGRVNMPEIGPSCCS